jgi:hypothetical protein
MLRRLFQKRQQRKLGATRKDVQEILFALDVEDPIDEQLVEVTAIQVMATLRNSRSDAYCQAEKAGFDFDAFLVFLQGIIEMLMPFIIKNRPADATAA